MKGLTLEKVTQLLHFVSMTDFSVKLKNHCSITFKLVGNILYWVSVGTNQYLFIFMQKYHRHKVRFGEVLRQGNQRFVYIMCKYKTRLCFHAKYLCYDFSFSFFFFSSQQNFTLRDDK